MGPLRLAALVGLASSGCAESEPPPAGSVSSSEDLGPLETNAVIGGRDGGYSGMAFGRSVWLYGDTILVEPDADGSGWHNNSFSWTDDLEPSDGLSGFDEYTDASGAPLYLLSLTPDEVAFNEAHAATDEAKLILWPAGLVEDPERDRVLVFYSKVLARPGAFNFDAVGTSIAVWSDLAQTPARDPRYGGDEPTLLFTDGRPFLAEGAVSHDGFLFAYDCSGLSKGCVIGRAPLADAVEQDSWRYWDGSNWSADWDRASSVMRAHDIVSVHYSDYLESFVAFYSVPLSNRVEYRTAPEPQGPWSGAGAAFSALTPTDGEVSYSAVAHAELSRDNVEYVSYHRGTAPFRSEIRLVRVEFE